MDSCIMTGNKNYIVTQCYGNEGVFFEYAFALLSMSRLYGKGFLPDTEIWIYTDKPEWFSRFADCPLPIHYRMMDAATIAQWQGNEHFVHRLKIELLRDITQRKQGNILYMDTDVVLTHHIDDILRHIGQDALYMHVQEGRICDAGNPVLQKLSVFLNSNDAMQAIDPGVAQNYMWNAGVLGFNTTYNTLLEQVLELTDKMYPMYPKHVVEQFCFSYHFQKHADVKSASASIIHYWNLKEMRELLSSFFDHFAAATWEELTILLALLQPHVYMQEKAAFYQGRSLAGKIKKDRWHPHIPDWQQLLHQL
jgi:hypothetical protein